MQKSLDQKIAAIHADPSGCKDFVLADDKMDSFVMFVQSLMENGSPYSWLDRKRDEITSETFPNLKFDFQKFQKMKPKVPGSTQSGESLDDELGGGGEAPQS